jgi:hypothetical protein
MMAHFSEDLESMRCDTWIRRLSYIYSIHATPQPRAL